MEMLVIGLLLGLWLGLAGGLLPFIYLVGAGHGLIAKFNGKENGEGAAMMFGVGYFFTALFAMGFFFAADRYQLPVPAYNTPAAAWGFVGLLALCIGLSTPIVVAGAKMGTHLFHHDVRFAHWWSMRVVAVGARRQTSWWSWF